MNTPLLKMPWLAPNEYYNLEEEMQEQYVEERREWLFNHYPHPFYQELGAITEETVESYLSDFYVHDLYTLFSNEPQRYLWVVRPHGTHLLPLVSETKEDYDHVTSFAIAVEREYSGREVDYYVIDTNEFTIDEVRNIPVIQLFELND